MSQNVRDQLLRLDNFYTLAVAGLPPRVRIELRKTRPTHRDRDAVLMQRAVQHAAGTARVIWHAHENEGANGVLFAPFPQHGALVVGADDRWNHADLCNSQR